MAYKEKGYNKANETQIIGNQPGNPERLLKHLLPLQRWELPHFTSL